MKKLFATAFLALTSLAFGATTTPVQLLSPIGSTAGQAIVSNGPTSAPTWQSVSFSSLTGIVPIVNGGTGASSQPSALTNILGSSTVPLANGGTGAATAANARTNLGLGTAAVQNSTAFSQVANNLSDLASVSSARTNLGLGTAAVQNSTVFAQTANNLSDLANAGTARTNLGLGTSATVNTGTSGATIPLLNGTNTWAAAQTFSVRPTFNGATPYDSANLTNPASTTGNLSQFAGTTSAQLASVLSDETGSGSAVFGTSPTISSPTISGGTISSTPISGSTGSFTTLSASSTVSGSGFTSLLAPYAPLASPALTGTPTAPTATAGTATTQLATTAFVTTSPTLNQPTINGITNGAAASAGQVGQIVSSNVPQGSAVALGSGVQTNITSINLTAGNWLIWGNLVTNPAGTTTTGNIYAGVSTTSATLPTYPNGGAAIGSAATIPAGQSVALPLGMQIVNISSSTTYYLVTTVTFGMSTMSAYGFLGAVRLR